MRPLVIVDGANVVGSVPDGWWRDRFAANERLRDALAAVARDGLPDRCGAPRWALSTPLDVLLVVEGRAREVPAVADVRVASAPGSGDDLVVESVGRALAEQPGRPCLVVTADRGLRERVERLGAVVAGPRTVRGG